MLRGIRANRQAVCHAQARVVPLHLVHQVLLDQRAAACRPQCRSYAGPVELCDDAQEGGVDLRVISDMRLEPEKDQRQHGVLLAFRLQVKGEVGAELNTSPEKWPTDGVVLPLVQAAVQEQLEGNGVVCSEEQAVRHPMTHVGLLQEAQERLLVHRLAPIPGQAGRDARECHVHLLHDAVQASTRLRALLEVRQHVESHVLDLLRHIATLLHKG
mmetsp:Transcript_79993/g.226350  ORF Transcript_79993/g.226350 Transcript_79993/m.226350 type:complete len:214 (-) Transcript_79993:187-828(-)